MIFKTLWAHRKQNGFVFAEIILITVLSFYFIDHIIVSAYGNYFCRPVGDFERDHLLVAQTDKDYELGEKRDSFELSFANLYALRDQVRALPEVQYACLANFFIGESGSYYYSGSVRTYSSEADSTHMCDAFQSWFTLHEQYFETQGLTPIEGSPTAAQLSEECPVNGAVISRSLAQELFGTDQVVGRRIVEWDTSDRAMKENGGPVIMNRHTIGGVLEDFRIIAYDRYAYTILTAHDSHADNSPELLIRLRPEVDAKTFVRRMSERLGEFRAGHEVLSLLETFSDYQKRYSRYSNDIFNSFLGIFLALLFVNVTLGTLGTYWLQLRKRTEDIGIMRSFGAKRHNIFSMVWGEIAILILIACIIGQIIWLQFAINIGLADGYSVVTNGHESDWVTSFWPHFFIICVIQYLLMLVIVTLGIIIPALIAMYRKPVNALRHE